MTPTRAPEQALLNILDSTVKYGKEGGRIRITWSVRLPYAGIRVDDDGPGLGCARRPGRGIGLTIVRTIIERAGGDVRASRSPLGGACFALRLPVKADSAALVS